MAERAPILQQKFTSADFEPLVGGKMWTYIAGTNTPAATYVDRDEETEHSNPIILDANGAVPEFWLASGLFKFVLKDADDVTVDTWDYVRSYATPEATPGESADNAAAAAASADESKAAALEAKTAAQTAQSAAATAASTATAALADVAAAQLEIADDVAAAEDAADAAALSATAADASADAAAASAAAAAISEANAAISAALAASVADFGATTILGSRASPEAIVAGTGIPFTGTGFMNVSFVKGNGVGTTDVSANPRIAIGAFIGQKLKIVQRSGTDLLNLADGQGLDLSGAWFGDAAGRELSLWWDGTNWKEEGRI